jgi:ArsR family transcriptional regulator
MAKRRQGYPLERLFSALADRTRLRLLNLMADREVCVCYFIDVLKAPQPTISRHLAYLRRAGLVASRKDGKWMHYRLSPPADAKVAAILRTTINSLREEHETQLDLQALGAACCGPKSLVELIGAPLPGKSGIDISER